MQLETGKGKIEVTDAELALLRGANPNETRKGLVVDLNGKTHGEKKAASLRERADGVFAGQMYFKGPNRKCEVEMGELEGGEGVYFLRVHWRDPAALPAEKPKPKVKLPYIAPRKLETLEDAEWYQALFAEPIPEDATVFYHHTVPMFPARKRPISYFGTRLGFEAMGCACAVRYLMDMSAAMVAGDDESIMEIARTRERHCPKWPGWLPEPGTPEFEAMEV